MPLHMFEPPVFFGCPSSHLSVVPQCSSCGFCTLASTAVTSNPSGAKLWLCLPLSMHGWLPLHGFCWVGLVFCGVALTLPLRLWKENYCWALCLGDSLSFPGTHIPCVAVLESLPTTVPLGSGLGSGLDTKLPTAASCPLSCRLHETQPHGSSALCVLCM